VRLRIIQVNPCNEIRLPRMPKESMLFLSAEEVATLAESFVNRYHATTSTQCNRGRDPAFGSTKTGVNRTISLLIAAKRPSEGYRRPSRPRRYSITMNRYGHLLPAVDAAIVLRGRPPLTRPPSLL
jgi:hypothetical protein